MLTSSSSSAALPLAYLTLRTLIILNWVMAGMIIVLLVAMPTRHWIMSSLNLSPGPEADRVVLGLRTIAVIGLAAVPINYAILKRLLAMVETVRAGDPFIAANAYHLQTIAWALLALQVLSMVIGTIAKRISTPDHPIHISAGFRSTAGSPYFSLSCWRRYSLRVP